MLRIALNEAMEVEHLLNPAPRTLAWAGTQASHAASRRTLSRFRFPSSRLTLTSKHGRAYRHPTPPVGILRLGLGYLFQANPNPLAWACAQASRAASRRTTLEIQVS